MHHLKRPFVSVVAVAALILVSCADNITAPTTTESGAATSISSSTSVVENTAAPTTEAVPETTAAPETIPPETTGAPETTTSPITVAPPGTGEGATGEVFAFADTFQSDVDALTLVFYQNIPGAILPVENCQEVLDATINRRAALGGQSDGVPADLVSATDTWYADMETFVTPCADGSQEFEVPAASENIPSAEPALALAESYGWERCEGEVCE